jgi:hypothetical protein
MSLLLLGEAVGYTVDNRDLLFRGHEQEGAPAVQRGETKLEAKEEVR